MHDTTYSSSFGVERLFGLPAEPVSEEIFKYTSENISIPVETGAFTLVLSRDVRRNTYIAAEIALRAAREDLSKDVWYVNTYAGVNFLKECFRQLFQNNGLGIPEPAEDDPEERKMLEKVVIPDYITYPEPAYDSPKPHPSLFHLKPDEPIPPERTKKFLKDGTGYVYSRGQYTRFQSDEEWEVEWAERRKEENRKRMEEARQAALPLQGKELDASRPLSNLHVFHVPIGEWDAGELAADIRSNGRMGCRQVLVINSFEYAPLTRGRKEKMAVELMQLCDQFHLAVVVFSHEMKRDIEAGIPGRGAIGILAAKASAVSRYADQFEHFYGGSPREPRT